MPKRFKNPMVSSIVVTWHLPIWIDLSPYSFFPPNNKKIPPTYHFLNLTNFKKFPTYTLLDFMSIWNFKDNKCRYLACMNNYESFSYCPSMYEFTFGIHNHQWTKGNTSSTLVIERVCWLCQKNAICGQTKYERCCSFTAKEDADSYILIYFLKM